MWWKQSYSKVKFIQFPYVELLNYRYIYVCVVLLQIFFGSLLIVVEVDHEFKSFSLVIIIKNLLDLIK